VLAASAAHFAPVFVEKDDEPELVERYDVTYYPALVWVDADGEELMRSVQPTSVDEVLDDLALAVDGLADADTTGD